MEHPRQDGHYELVEGSVRTEAGWPAEATQIRGLAAYVALPAVDAVIALAEVFRRTEPRSAFEVG